MTAERVPVGAIIEFATKRTKERVLPFQFKKWLKISILLALAGALSAGSCSFKFPQTNRPAKQEQPAAPAEKNVPAVSATAASGTQTDPQNMQPAGAPAADQKAAPQQAPAKPAAKPMQPKILTALISLGSILVLVLIWFSWYVSPLSLGLYDFLIHGDLGLRGMLERYRSEGNAIFKFGWVCILFFIASIGGTIALAVVFKNAAVIILAVVSCIAAFCAAVVLFVYWPFIIGAMYLKQLSIGQAFIYVRRAGLSIGQLLLLALINLGIGIIAGVVTMLVWLLSALCIALVLGLPALAAYFLLKSVLALGILKVMGVVYGGFAIAAGVILVFTLSAPVKLWAAYFNYAFLHRISPVMQFFNLTGQSGVGTAGTEPAAN